MLVLCPSITSNINVLFRAQENWGQGATFVSALKERGHRQWKLGVPRDDGMLSKAHSFPVTTEAPRSLLHPAAPWNYDSLLRLGLWPPWVNYFLWPPTRGAKAPWWGHHLVGWSLPSCPLKYFCCLDSWPWRNLSRLTSDPEPLTSLSQLQPGPESMGPLRSPATRVSLVPASFSVN